MSRFSFGINLDDPWRYAGLMAPKSIIIPHLLSASLPEGMLIDKVDDLIIREHGDVEPKTQAARATLALAESLADAKVDFVRCWFPWRYFEPRLVAEGQIDDLLQESYESWPLDDFVNRLTEHGIGLVPVLACGYQRMLPDALDVDRTQGTYLRRAAVHARLLVKRYRDRIRHWQIENEPNWWKQHEGAGWRHGVSWLDPHDFKAELLKVLNLAVHDEDPSAKTIINLEGDTGLAGASAYAAYCDILGVDFYPNYRSSSPIQTSVFRQADELAKECEKPVLISETGYPSGPLLLGYTQSKQAEYVRAACEQAFALRGVIAVGIWRYADTAWKSFPDQENHFGLIDSKGTPKSGCAAFKETIGRLR